MQGDLAPYNRDVSFCSEDPRYPRTINDVTQTSKGYLAVGAVTSGALPVRSIPPFGPGL